VLARQCLVANLLGFWPFTVFTELTQFHLLCFYLSQGNPTSSWKQSRENRVKRVKSVNGFGVELDASRHHIRRVSLRWVQLRADHGRAARPAVKRQAGEAVIAGRSREAIVCGLPLPRRRGTVPTDESKPRERDR